MNLHRLLDQHEASDRLYRRRRGFDGVQDLRAPSD